MSLWEILVIAVGLSMDAFAVALGASASQRARGARATFRLSFHFGLFQFLMPVCGWLLGVTVAPYIVAVDHWVAFGLLSLVGVRMVRAGMAGQAGGDDRGDPSRGMTLIALSIATSIDALAVGLTLAMIGTSIWYASVIIGLVTGFLSLVAIGLGSRLGQALGRRMEIVGGLLLIAIGVRILVQHL